MVKVRIHIEVGKWGNSVIFLSDPHLRLGNLFYHNFRLFVGTFEMIISTNSLSIEICNDMILASINFIGIDSRTNPLSN